MRVLHVIGPMEVGGAQTQLLALLKAAHDERWQAHVCATAPGPMTDAFREVGLPVHELKRRGSPGVLRMAALRRIVERGAFDVVHGTLWQANVYCRLAVAGRRRRPAVVIAERGVPVRAQGQLRVDRVLARWTDLYIANSQAVASFMRRVHPIPEGALVVIPNAVDDSVFFPAPRGVRGPAFRVGALGRLDAAKGFDIAIAAFRALGHRPEVELHLAGSGPEEARLRDLARGLRVHFVGPLPPGPDVASFLRTLDVVVAPSRIEGRPNAVLEALACGVPVIGSDIPAMREFGSAVTLVPPEDPSGLARAIEAMMQRVDTARGPRAAAKVPSFSALTEDYLRAFELAVARRDR